MAASVIPEVEASLTKTYIDPDTNIVDCGVCNSLLQDPRTLSCLHSFCLKCLKQLLEEKVAEGALSLPCPTCSAETKLPDGGVAELGVIAFISRQRNEKLMRQQLDDIDAKVECTACDGTETEANSEALTRCFECDDFLCERCTNMHKIIRSLKQHPLFTLQELRSGKAPLSLPDQNTCPKHNGETLTFFCETCDIPICSKCAIVTHRHPEHKQAELETAAEERKQQILTLEETSAQVATKMDELIAENEDLEANLKRSSSNAMDELDETNELLKSQLLENLEKMYTESKEELLSIEEKKMKVITTNLFDLKSNRSRLSTSRKIAREVTKKGSEFEIAAVYSTVTGSLKQLHKKELINPSKTLGKVGFNGNEDVLPEIAKLGLVNAYQAYDAKLLTEFGDLKNGRGVEFMDDGKVVVSNHDADECFSHVYDDNGNLSFKFDNASEGKDPVWPSCPRCVVYSPEEGGRYFGTDDTQYVKLYSGDPVIYQNRYNVVSPAFITTDTEGSKVQGLALDKNGHLIVGNVTKNYVSIMKTDGTPVTSMDVPIKPWVISATPTDNIIISSYEDKAVHVIDRTGEVLFTLNPPYDVAKEAWNPSGICCSEDGHIFVANYQGRVGIFQYDIRDGNRCVFVGCNTEDVTQPWGLALSKDEKKLAVADNTCVKIFELQQAQ